jgi:CheY-like chemotaxis protein
MDNNKIIVNEKSDILSQLETQFLTNMSHEIRTPLNAILGMVYLALREDSNQQVKEYLKKIQFSANNLLAITNDILDVSKVSEGKMTLHDADFSIKEIITSIKAQLASDIKKKQLKLEVLISPDVPETVVGDSLRVSQVIISLLDNAIKFTEKGSVELKVTLDGEVNKVAYITFTVSDTGIGISEEKLKTIYDVFMQVDSSLARQNKGIGLGLNVSKRVVELMGGTISAKSKFGEGSSFSFTLPLRVATVTAPATTVVSNHEHPRVDEINTDKMILIVEDNELNREVIVTILEDYGLTVDTATNGIEAIAAVKEKKYDIIFMDVQMPLMDGLEATRQIRQLPDMGAIPIIALTAHARDSDYQKSIEAGMNSHIVKPIKPRAFLNMLDEWLGGK